MNLLEALAEGHLGPRLRVPGSWPVERDQERSFVLVDPERQLLWHGARHAWRLDLDPAHEAALLRDVARASRPLFERHFKPPVDGPAFLSPTEPRTADPGWSPVVEASRRELAGRPLLVVVHRLTYQPGAEQVLGRVLVPLEEGMVELVVVGFAETTGQRESLLFLLKSREASALPGEVRLTQAEIDDPRHDDTMSFSPLSRVRAALRWLLDEGALAPGTPPRPAARTGPEVPVPEAGCVVTPPPRFLPTSPGAVPGPATMRVFTRVSLTGFETPCMLDVWRPDGVRISPHDLGGLREYAVTSARGWAGQGCTDVEVDVREAGPPGARPGLVLRVRFAVQGVRYMALQCWFVEPDGSVFRLCRSSPEWVTEVELEDEVRAACASFSRPGRPGRPSPQG